MLHHRIQAIARVAAAALAVGILLAVAPAAQAAPVTPVDAATSCSNWTPLSAYEEDHYGLGLIGGLIELRYNSCSRDAWARHTQYTGPCEHSNGEGCGYGEIHRNSDGATYTCSLANGQTQCFTNAVYDANVTSYAYGNADGGDYLEDGYTGNW